MTTEIDHDAIKEQIVTILKANATLFDANDDTKLMDISVGKPNPDGIPNVIPGAYVTNAPILETNRIGFVQSNAPKIMHHTVRYLIVIALAGTDAADTENKLDDLQKVLLQTMEADTNIGGNVDISFAESVQNSIIKRSGDMVQLRQITLKCTVTTG